MSTPDDIDIDQHIGEEAEAPEDLTPQELDDNLDHDGGDTYEDQPNGPLTAAQWRLARCLTTVRNEVEKAYPKRSKVADGTIGDARHQAEKSDHNPNAQGVVRAWDITSQGIPAAAIAEAIRQKGLSGFAPLRNGGYVIFNRRIASWAHDWKWRQYTGEDPHTGHIHLSVSLDASGYDSTEAWHITTNPKTGDRHLGLTNPPMVGEDVKGVQRVLHSLGNDIAVDGTYGPETARLVGVFQRNRHIDERGVGPKTWAALRAIAHGGK